MHRVIPDFIEILWFKYQCKYTQVVNKVVIEIYLTKTLITIQLALKITISNVFGVKIVGYNQ